MQYKISDIKSRVIISECFYFITLRYINWVPNEDHTRIVNFRSRYLLDLNWAEGLKS